MKLISTNRLIFLIIFIIITIYIQNIITSFDIFFIFNSPCDRKLFVDNKNNKLNPLLWERPEQYFITKYVSSSDCVLELGGRYGLSSYCIQNKLINKKLHLVVEPDKSVIVALDKNIRNNYMECDVFNGVISSNSKGIVHSGLGTYTYNYKDNGSDNGSDNSSDIEFKSLYSLELGTKFNTIVVDCEGCFVEFFKENINYILENITTIILENDRINHNEILNILVNNNFKIVENYFNHMIILLKD